MERKSYWNMFVENEVRLIMINRIPKVKIDYIYRIDQNRSEKIVEITLYCLLYSSTIFLTFYCYFLSHFVTFDLKTTIKLVFKPTIFHSWYPTHNSR